VEAVFLGQADRAQLVMVGDSAQQIYAWRGARDVMTGFPGRLLPLTQSFRFGATLAAEANRWLRIAGAPIRLRGHTAINTTIGATKIPDAILCQTNAGAMDEVMGLLKKGRRVALAGGGGPLRDLAQAALDLKAGKGTTHYELLLFKSWGELQDYAENDPAGADLLPFVEVIDDLGAEEVLAAVTRLAPESDAEVTVSTAHKAKGREWSSVRIGYDFAEPDVTEDGQPGPIREEFARLAYVAVSRARHQLDLGGLSWIATHPQGR
jgi:superfamily I DNA/RNA helicase